jgi:(p)ppGpp synthase/HD superfamily hydrolase
MSNIDTALEIAIQAHSGQKDKAGKPYILHPLRLMHQCDTDEEKIVALLHDTVEDSDVTLEMLRESGFSSNIVKAIGCLTKINGELYENFIQRISVNKLATKVKIKDIGDNLDVSRLDSLSENDLGRIKKYHESLKFLEAL